MHAIIIDNNGETFDRYTIIDPETGDMYGASNNPFHHQGFGQYCGNVASSLFSMGWKPAKKKIKEAVNRFMADCSHLGRVVSEQDIPQEVREYIQMICGK